MSKYNIHYIVKSLFISRKAALEAAIRKKIECERKALQVVEHLLEDDITEELFVDSVCSFLNLLFFTFLMFPSVLGLQLSKFQTRKMLI